MSNDLSTKYDIKAEALQQAFNVYRMNTQLMWSETVEVEPSF